MTLMAGIGEVSSQNRTSTASEVAKANNPMMLGKDDFLMLFLESLKNQDPMSPMSNAEMMQQMSQLGQMEAIANLSITVDEMKSSLLGNQVQQGSSLLGKEITALDSEGNLIKGKPDELVVNNGVVELLINNKNVKIGQIASIGIGKDGTGNEVKNNEGESELK